MDADQLFAVSGPIAMTGWAVLAVSPLAPRAAQIAAGIAIPAVLSLAYAVLILVAWSDADGGFDSLANVMMLFDSPMVALAGWVHYLAFDLFVGAWVVRRARRVPRTARVALRRPIGSLDRPPAHAVAHARPGRLAAAQPHAQADARRHP